MTLPPCGHGNGTHPSDCWWPAAMEMAAEARAPLEEQIATLRVALDAEHDAISRAIKESHRLICGCNFPECPRVARLAERVIEILVAAKETGHPARRRVAPDLEAGGDGGAGRR